MQDQFEIEETILKEGIGEVPQDGEEVYFFFCSKDQSDKLLAASQHSATKCIIGRGWLIPELEYSLQRMKQGQRSLIKVYHNPSTREFYNQHEIEIIRFGRRGIRPWQMIGEQPYNHAASLKLTGNQSMKNQEYADAQNYYNEALKVIKDDYSDREVELAGQLRSNLSLTYLKNKDYDNCIKHANDVLTRNPHNVKLLHRRAVAYIEIGEFDNARQDLEMAIKLDPQNEEVTKELEQIGQKEKVIKKKQQERAKKMLFGE